VALIPEPAPAPPEDIAGSGSNPATQPAPAATVAPDRELVAAIDQQDLLRSLLGQPGVRRLLISVDAMDNSLARVEESLRIVPRAVPEQARIRIAQGIAIDPQNPDDAVVYAVVFDEAELANFRKSLADALPSAIIDDQAAPPSLLALLAESPEFDFSSVDARGTILPPRPGSIATELARRVMSPFEHILPAFAEPDPSLPIPPFPIAGESSSLRSAGPIPKTIEAAFLRRPVVPDAVRSRETVYLVWLTQRA
jgi:hypothetical protein